MTYSVSKVGSPSLLLVLIVIVVLGLSFSLSQQDTTALAKSPAQEPAQDPDQQLPETISFNAHVRPIMSNTCFACHGPDDEANESGVRLDSFVVAVEEGSAIVPGDVEGSAVYQRLIDQDDPMPPANFRHQLTSYQKAIFKKWIEQGAKYEEHWSYTPIRRPEIPQLVDDDFQSDNPIDAFVLRRLQLAGIKPSLLADKSTLLRRLSLDLIGLPPTPAELDSFLGDETDNAYQRQVDRLLASPHFGERMASTWLDTVRFSDTVGFHGDQNQRIFPYRDYVINSLNSNKPFDDFVLEQLAGDLLPSPTDEQLAATGLVRLGMMTREGGAQPGEYLSKYMADRVRMVGTAFLGATTGCCECHNHKYDPFTAKDFYSLGAFFADLQQWGVYSDYTYTPNADLKGFNNDYPFPPELRLESESLKKEIALLQSLRDAECAKQLGIEVLNSDKFKQWAARVADLLRVDSGTVTDGWAIGDPEEIKLASDLESKKIDDRSLLLTGATGKKELIVLENRFDVPVDMKTIRLEVIPDEAHGNHVGRSKDGKFELEFIAEIDRNVSKPKPKLLPILVRPQFIRFQLNRTDVLSLAELKVFSPDENGDETNVANQGKATQSSVDYEGPAELAIDGNTSGNFSDKSITHTEYEKDPWWELDLGGPKKVSRIEIWNRTDNGWGKRLKDYDVIFLDKNRKEIAKFQPEQPKPNLELEIPDEIDQTIKLETIEFGLIQANRSNPKKYAGGSNPLSVENVWRSGPIAWQLPNDETKTKHTAVYHLKTPTKLDLDDRLVVTIQSSDVGRVRVSASPLDRYVIDDEIGDMRSLLNSILNEEGEPDGAARARLLGAYYASTTPEDKLSAKYRQLRDAIVRCESGLAMTMIAQAVNEQDILETKILPRGDWQDKTGEVVLPATPSFLPPAKIEKDRRLTRLDLANWLVADNNPLVARNRVNRIWQHFFGRGLSGQLDDLGNQGEWPSHPELLDWLASEFKSDWDTKRMMRLIVTSHTYRQQAMVHSELLTIDPYNRLLAQQSARRLEAESIRDNALAISGLLEKSYIGGPSVFPYQPEGYYANLQFPSRQYKSTPDRRQYRRGVYMHWQRTFLHPMLVNFDAPSRDECVAGRTLSNSPQQALTLLNDPSFVEASKAMADRLLYLRGDDDEFDKLLDIAFKTALSRNADSDEKESLKKLFDQQLEHFQNNDADADSFLKNGYYEILSDAKPPEIAAWAQVCRVILNLHETITRF